MYLKLLTIRNKLLNNTQLFLSLLTHNCEKVYKNFVFFTIIYTFVINKTCHASHKNSAPGRVFLF